MSVSEFIDSWIENSGSDDIGAGGNSLLYLKDWHFVKVGLLQVCSLSLVLF